MKKWQALLIIIILTSSLRIIKLSLDEFCLGADCSFYLYNIRFEPISGIKTEPFYFMIAKLVNPVINEILFVKLMQIILPIVMMVGIYLLVKDIFNTPMIAVTLLLISFFLGYNRMWVDNYRNILLLAMLPYFLYFYLKGKVLIPILMLSLMAWTHITFIVIIPFMLLYSIFKRNRKVFLKSIIIGSIAVILWFPYITYGGHGKDAYRFYLQTSDYVPYEPLSHLYYMNYFSPIFFIACILTLHAINFKNPFEVGFFCLFLTITFLPFLPFVSEPYRLNKMLSFPIALLSGIFYERVVKRNKRKLFVFIFSIAMTFNIVVGTVYIFNEVPNINAVEKEAYLWMRDNTEDNSWFVTTCREYYFYKYIAGKNNSFGSWWFIAGEWGERGSNVDVWGNPYFFGHPTLEDMFYSENLTETIKIAGKLKEKYNSPVYVFWRYHRIVPYNNTSMKEKENHFQTVFKKENIVIVKL